MKIIGKADDGRYYDLTYICTVTRSEIEKYMGLYYNQTNAKLPEIKVGDTIDLGKGHDHLREITDAMGKTQAFVAAHQQVVNAILNGLNFQRIAESSAPAQPEPTT